MISRIWLWRRDQFRSPFQIHRCGRRKRFSSPLSPISCCFRISQTALFECSFRASRYPGHPPPCLQTRGLGTRHPGMNGLLRFFPNNTRKSSKDPRASRSRSLRPTAMFLTSSRSLRGWWSWLSLLSGALSFSGGVLCPLTQQL
jgi:hypothetical protein